MICKHLTSILISQPWIQRIIKVELVLIVEVCQDVVIELFFEGVVGRIIGGLNFMVNDLGTLSTASNVADRLQINLVTGFNINQVPFTYI